MIENQRAKILIVDDEPANIQVLNESLKDEYDTFFALHGAEAIAAAVKTRPDLILLDVMMPGMNGFEVRKALADDESLRDIPVIFVTALGMPEQESQGLELGAVDYITKPFNPGITRLRIRNQLELKRQRDLLLRRTEELEAALNEIKTLSGLLPICAWCKNIRDDAGYWSSVEKYLSTKLDTRITHSICPACTKKHFADVLKD